MKPLLEVRRLGRTLFEEAYALQKELVTARGEGRIGDVLILTEHDPVVTVGRGTDVSSVDSVGPPVHEIERGGEATYHGPGQLVAYVIRALPEGERDLHAYLRDLEEVIIGVLGEFKLSAERCEGQTGVWIGRKKIASIGVAVSRWVTYHGLALNLHTDLAAFHEFRPCGLDANVMTRLSDHVELPPTNLLAEVLLVKHFCLVFGYELPQPAPQEGAEGDGRFPRLPVL